MGNIFQNEPTKTERPHYKVLVIGKSGAGKTTTINMLVNLASSIKYSQERKIAISQIVELFQNGQIAPYVLKNNIKEYSVLQSDQLKQSSESQTQRCNIYEINKEGYDISFIDTPGACDSQGKEADKRNQAAIWEFVKSHSDINCILYVHRSIETRKCIDMSYFNSPLKNILSDQIRKNFIVCFTNTINPMKIPAIEVLKEQGIPLDKQIFFENDCLIPFNLLTFSNQQEQQSYQSRAEIFWKRNKQQFDSLIAYLQQMSQSQQVEQPVMNQQEILAMKKEVELRYNTQAIMKLISDLISHSEYLLRCISIKQASLENQKQQLNNIQKTIKRNNKYALAPVEVSGVKTFFLARQSKRLLTPVMFCYICLKICHQECTIEELTENESVNIRKCKAFCEGKYEKCTSCSHHSAYHSHTNEIQVDVITSIGRDCQWSTDLQNFQNLISEDDCLLEKIHNQLITALSKVVVLEIKLEEDSSIHNFKCQIVKEYFQYSYTKAKENLVITQEQQNKLIKELSYLNNVYQTQKFQPGDSLKSFQNMLSQEQQEQLIQSIQLEKKRLKQQYQL